MSSLSNIPDDFDDLLLWINDRSEAAWAICQAKTPEELKAEIAVTAITAISFAL